MKKIILILLLMPFLTLGYGQKSKVKQVVKLPTNFQERLDFNAAYYGNMLWNPGLKFGAEYVWRAKQIVKTNRKNKTKTITKEKILSGDVGFFWDPQSHVGVFNYYGIIFRRTNSKRNRQLNFKVNPLGYYRSFLPETYAVTESGVDKVTLPGRNYYAPSFSIGMGKLQNGKTLKARYVNLNFMFLTPYNTNLSPLISLDFGFRFNGKKRNRMKTLNN